MLDIRLTGDPDEARAPLMEALRNAGCEVLISTVKQRTETSQLYGSVSMPTWRTPVRATAAQPATARPVRAPRTRRAIEDRRRPR